MMKKALKFNSNNLVHTTNYFIFDQPKGTIKPVLHVRRSKKGEPSVALEKFIEFENKI